MADALRKVIVDGIPLEVNDTAAAAIDKLQNQLSEALAAKDAAEKKVGGSVTVTLGDKSITYTGEELIKVLDAKDAEIAALKKDVITPEARDAMVADWAKLIGDAKRLVPELVTDGKTCVQIRREAVAALAKDGVGKAVAEAVLAGKKVEDADADTIRATFNALAAAVKADDGQQQHSANDALADALAGQKNANDGTQTQPTQKLVGRDAMIARQAQAWRGGQK